MDGGTSGPLVSVSSVAGGTCPGLTCSHDRTVVHVCLRQSTQVFLRPRRPEAKGLNGQTRRERRPESGPRGDTRTRQSPPQRRYPSAGVTTDKQGRTAHPTSIMWKAFLGISRTSSNYFQSECQELCVCVS